MTRIAINGFGRIGRNFFRAAKKNGAGFDMVAVNDLTDNHTLAHLLRYDSVHGRYDGTVEVNSDGLVVDGDPGSESADGCFPPALLESGDGGRREPLAADLRRYADGRQLALLKIVAGLLGIRLDLLRRRDAQRRFRRRLSWSVVSVVLAGLLGWLVYAKVTTQAAAEAQRASTEELLSFMLGDLERLGSTAGQPGLAIDFAAHRERAETLGLADFTDDGLLERALEWREAGLELSWQGQQEAALEPFLDSKAAILELQRREGNTERVLFELGQAEFYVGEVYANRGEPEQAREH